MNEEKNSVKSILVVGSGVLAALYLLNPGAGFFEIFPDNIPIIGNMDEVSAAAIVIASLRYFGIDVMKAFTRKKLP